MEKLQVEGAEELLARRVNKLVDLIRVHGFLADDHEGLVVLDLVEDVELVLDISQVVAADVVQLGGLVVAVGGRGGAEALRKDLDELVEGHGSGDVGQNIWILRNNNNNDDNYH